MEVANGHLKELDRLKKEQEKVIRKIKRSHDKLQQIALEKVEGFKDKLLTKLRSLYIAAKTLAESEESVCTLCEDLLEGLIAPGHVPPNRKKPDSGEQKRKRIKTEADSARLSSPTYPRAAVPHHNIVLDDRVAARVTEDGVENHEWIVVKVTGIDHDANKYEVIDEEPDDDGEIGQRTYKLPRSRIIPFPKKMDASNALDFLPGHQVLAVYPGTTALYKASVVGANHKKRSDDYWLEFDGDEEEGVDGLPQRPVPFHDVVQLPYGHRQ